MEDTGNELAILTKLELLKYEQNDEIILKKNIIDIKLNHLKYLGNIFLEGKRIWAAGLTSKFRISTENLTSLKLKHVVDLSGSVLDLPNINYLSLESSIINIRMGKKIKDLLLLTSTIPENFTNPEIELNVLMLVTDKKMSTLPKTNLLWSNFGYRSQHLVSHHNMDAPLNNKIYICYVDYIHPKLIETHRDNLALMYEWKYDLLTRLTNLGFHRIRCDIQNIEEIKFCKCKLFKILENYDIVANNKSILFITKNILRGGRTDISLPTDIISQIFNKIVDQKKRTQIAKLLRKDIWEYYPDLNFEETMKKIDYVVSDGFISSKKAQIAARHARSLRIDKNFIPQKIFADRITHLTFDSYLKSKSFNGFDFPNLIFLHLCDYDSRLEDLKFNKEKLKFLKINKMTIIPSKVLGISENCIDLSLYPNLVRFTLNGITRKDSWINNPKNAQISLWRDQIHLIRNLENPIILQCLSDLDTTKISHLKKYNIIKFVLKTTLYTSPGKILDSFKKNGIKTNLSILTNSECKHDQDIDILSASLIRQKPSRPHPIIQFEIK